MSGLSCPSSRPDIERAAVFGVVAGTPDAPRVRYLAGLVPVAEVLGDHPAPLPLTEFLRIAAPCVEARCRHHADGQCRLGEGLARLGRSMADGAGLQPCPLRASCRWWHERGGDACAACAGVVTDRPR